MSLQSEKVFNNLATMNISVLKQLDIKDILVVHPLIDTQSLKYIDVQKTKDIKVKPVNCIIKESKSGSQSIMDFMALKTLEGYQNITQNSFVCVGIETNDFWQQSGTKLHDKYDLVSMDSDGWVIYRPKPDNLMNGSQVSSDHNTAPNGGFSIVNPQWGDVKYIDEDTLDLYGITNPNPANIQEDGTIKIFLHYGVVGDWILQNRDDRLDTYRVKETFFNSTYDIC